MNHQPHADDMAFLLHAVLGLAVTHPLQAGGAVGVADAAGTVDVVDVVDAAGAVGVAGAARAAEAAGAALGSIDLLDAAWRQTHGYALAQPLHGDATGDRVARLADHSAVRRVLDVQRAWIDGGRVLAWHSAKVCDAAGAAGRGSGRSQPARAGVLLAAALQAAFAQQAFDGAHACLQVFRSDGEGHGAGVAALAQRAHAPLVRAHSDPSEAVDFMLHHVVPDRGAAWSGVLIGLRDPLEAARETDADVQRRLAQLRYLTTTLLMASHSAPDLPAELADDYLRVVAIALLAWAWARIDRVAAVDDARWARPSAAFRRWVLPEFEMRLGIVKRACDAVIAAQVANA